MKVDPGSKLFLLTSPGLHFLSSVPGGQARSYDDELITLRLTLPWFQHSFTWIAFKPTERWNQEKESKPQLVQGMTVRLGFHLL